MTEVQKKLRQRLVRAIKEIERLRAELESRPDTDDQPIAIVGVGLRLPGGVASLDDLWSLLATKTDAVGPIPLERWDAEEVYDPEPGTDNATYVREAALLEQVDQFDPGFFNISPREAKSLDPQHRLLLEASWEALERAHIVPASLLDTNTGVFVGIGPSDYQRWRSSETDAYQVMGTHTSFAAGRVAYTLGLQGPAVSIDTACSSSLVALHLACHALRTSECDLTLAAGVQVLAAPDSFIQLSQTRALAADGRCKTFSARADGYGRGEGVVVLALQRLDDARDQRRKILGLVHGTAVNHDGASSGITAPNGTSQQKVLRAALADAGLGPADVDLVECHGTGTKLGDPIEVQALAQVYGRGRAGDRPLLIGALKPNIGHLESAAGLAGVAKVLAELEREQLAPNIHSTPPNPHLDWDQLPVEVVDSERDWARSDVRARVAGVSGFGLSGTNSHVLIGEPPLEEGSPAAASTSDEASSMLVFPVSGRSEAALRAQAETLAKHVRGHEELGLRELGYALATTRSHFEHRACILAESREDLLSQLGQLAADPKTSNAGRVRSEEPSVAVLFTGQGSQRPGMGRGLYNALPVFRQALDGIAEVLDVELGESLLELMFNDSVEARERIHQTRYTQPSLFAFELALYRQLEAWGLRASVVMGHSIGELVAAHVAGVFSLADACRLVVARGNLMQSLPAGGAMVSIQASEVEVRAELGDQPEVDVAGVNGPHSTVASGPSDTVEALAARFTEMGRKVKRLKVSHAFHSRLMDPMLADFSEVAESLTYHKPTMPIVSNVSGELAPRGQMCSAGYWVSHVRSAVRFNDGVQSLERFGTTVMVECGPRGILSSMAAGCLSDDTKIDLIASIHDRQSEPASAREALARMHIHGIPIDWDAYFGEPSPAPIDLPTYAFQRQPYWHETLGGRDHGTERELAGHYALAGERISLMGERLLHIIDIGPGVVPELADHIIHGRIVVPGAFHVSVLLAIGESLWPERAVELRNVEFIRAIVFERKSDVGRLFVELSPHEGGFAATVFTREDGVRAERVTAELGPVRGTAHFHDERLPAEARGPDQDFSQFCTYLHSINISWGPAWFSIRRGVALAADDVVGHFAEPADASQGLAPFGPSFVDNSFAMSLLGQAQPGEGDVPQLPFAVQRVVWYGRHAPPRFARSRLVESSVESSVSSIRYWDAEGVPLGHVERFVARRAPSASFLRRSTSRELHELHWRQLGVQPEVAARRVAVVGDEELGAALSSKHRAQSYPDVASLVAGAEDSAPELIVLMPPAVGQPAVETASRLLAQFQAISRSQALATARLVVVSQGALAASAGEAPVRLDQASIWGFVRTAQVEQVDRDLAIIDIDDHADSRVALSSWLTSDEPQLALRRGLAHVPRLRQVSAVEASDEQGTFDPSRTVLITGGTGGLGRIIARHLVEAHGVRRLLLVSRRGLTPEAEALRDELAPHGASVEVATCDVSDRNSVERCLAAIPSDHPLGSVIHAAGVVDDGTLASLTRGQVERVFAAKVEGALILDALTSELELDAFVLFSSLAGVAGSAGQANYAAANAVLDALACRRVAQGRAGLSLAWGPWAGEGMAARLNSAAKEKMARAGVPLLDAKTYLRLFDLALFSQAPVLVPARFDAVALAKSSAPLPAVFRGFVRQAVQTRAEDSDGGDSLRGELAGLAIDERATYLESLVGQEVATVLGLGGEGSVELERPLQELGLDSLMAVEIRNRLQTVTGLRLPSTLVFDYPTVRELGELILGRFGEVGPQVEAVSSVATELEDEDAIAIVSLACRFPGGVNDPEGLWSLLDAGAEGIGPFPTNRGWPPVSELHDPDPDQPGKSLAAEGGFLYDAADFAPEFFGISPREAEAVDPQQRLLLELSWEALERAGIVPETLERSATGVYIGAMYNDYAMRFDQAPARHEGNLNLGSAGSVASGRIAYTLGLQGPTLTVDTACSSSLVALHIAAQALRNRECELALCGGVCVMATPATFVMFSRQRGLAPDGRSKPFSSRANGVGWGEGAGLLVLERLADARRNGHPVLALVRGSAINQDGRSQGLTAPNGPSQQRVIRRALEVAGLRPEDVQVVEAHGTGTKLGDPIEAGALHEVYGAAHSPQSPLWLGSIKSNIGHTQAAAGVASVIKMVLALGRRRLPKSLYGEDPTPHVDWDGSIQLLAQARDWESTRGPRRAGISSFGISGTNAHVLLEEAPAADSTASSPREDNPRTYLPLLFSAKSEAELRRQCELVGELDVPLRDVAFSLATARSAFPLRASVTVTALTDLDPEQLTIIRASSPKLAMMFTGQGAQRQGMGQELASAYPEFRAHYETVIAELDKELDRPLAEVIASDVDALGQTAYTQPALFALEVALYRMLEGWGLRPDFVLGHSIGELSAAHVAGVFSLSDACRLVTARGRLMQALPGGGAMVSIRASRSVVEPLILGRDGVDLAAVNDLASTVISGDEESVVAAAAELEALGYPTKRLRVSHAFHSHRMDPMLDAFIEVASSIEYAAPQIPLVSNLTGELVDAAELCSPLYWARQIRESVRFADCVATLIDEGVDLYLELGPHSVLSAMVAACEPEQTERVFEAVPVLRRGESELETVPAALARVHDHGRHIDWRRYFAELNPRLVELPTYPFVRRRFWLDGPELRAPSTAQPDEFWELVSREEVHALVRLLDLSPKREREFAELLPALRAWHERRARAATVDGWRYQVEWTPLGSARPKAEEEGKLLLVRTTEASQAILGAQLVDAFGPEQVVEQLVLPVEADFESVLSTIRAGAADASLVVSLLGIDDSRDPTYGALTRGLTHTLALVHALGSDRATPSVRLITRGAVALGMSEGLDNPSQASIASIGLTVSLEQPKRDIGVLDIPRELDPSMLSRIPAALRRRDFEDQLALRAGGLFGRRLVPAPASGELKGEFEPRGTAIVTGGTGALGARVARWLVANGAPHVVLTSRRGLQAPGAAELQAELERGGSRVSIVSCDTGSREAVAKLIDSLDPVHPLRVVIHVAGVTGSMGHLDQLSPEVFQAAFAAKVDGARHFHDLTSELDAFVMFSSIAGVWGSAQQGAYASANAFLDAFAVHRSRRGLPASSMAWGPWAGAGMAGDATGDYLARQGLRLFEPERAMEAFARSLAGSDEAVTIVDVDWDTFVPLYASQRARPLLNKLMTQVEDTTEVDVSELSLAEQLADIEIDARQDWVLTLVLEQTAIVLGLSGPDALEPESGFADLGIDSLMAVELRQRLQRATMERLPATLTFDYPTPGHVSKLLLERAGAMAAGGGVEDEGGEPAQPDPSEELEELEELDEDALLDAVNMFLDEGADHD